MLRATLTTAGTALAVLIPVSAAWSAPVVRQASGADTASITPIVDQFRSELGNNNGGGLPAATGRRQIAWDGVPDLRSGPAFMPEGQFRGVGALFTGPGTGFQVSGDDNSADAAPFDDPDQVRFSDIDPSYATSFATFSAQRLFTPIGTNLYDTLFVVPGSATPATTNGFGAVFSDVDGPGSSIEYFGEGGVSLGSFPVPATAGTATFSFLGVRFDAGERIERVRVTNGPTSLAAGVTDVSQAGTADLVVNDDFIFGEPQPAQPDTARPNVAVGAPSRIRLRGLVRRGARVTLTPSEAVTLDVSLLASPKVLSIARFELVLASRSFARASTARTFRLRAPRRLLKRTPRRFNVRLRVVAIDASGNRRAVTRLIQVRR